MNSLRGQSSASTLLGNKCRTKKNSQFSLPCLDLALTAEAVSPCQLYRAVPRGTTCSTCERCCCHSTRNTAITTCIMTLALSVWWQEEIEIMKYLQHHIIRSYCVGVWMTCRTATQQCSDRELNSLPANCQCSASTIMPSSVSGL